MSGNHGGGGDDPQGMSRCDGWREVLSAVLDGEATAAEQRDARAHSAGCRACRAWAHEAAAVTRRTRTGPAEAGPDLVEAALAHLPHRPWSRRPVARRTALGVVGAIQLVLAVVALVGVSAHGAHGMDHGTPLMGAGLAHVAHETAAWNLALGAAFVVGAWRPRHLAGLLPGLGVFVAVLAVLSVLDLTAGRVDVARVAAHVVVLAGLVLALLVVRDGPHRGPAPWPGRRERQGDRDGDEDVPSPPTSSYPGRSHPGAPYPRSTPDVA